MAYISSESVKAKREEIKKEFPSSKGWKFSIVGKHYSSIICTIMESPFDLDEKLTINDYYNEPKFSKQPEIAEAFKKIQHILNKGNYDNSNIQVDHFDVGWYSRIEIGKWDKKHIYNKLS